MNWEKYEISSVEGGTDSTRIFPVCNDDEDQAWIRVGYNSASGTTGDMGPCPDVDDARFDSADLNAPTVIGYFTCSMNSTSTMSSYYGKMKNQDGTGISTSPEVLVMNARGEFQFSSDATAQTEFETSMYVSNFDDATYRVTDLGNYMALVEAKDAVGSSVESVWTLSVIDRPLVCDNDPSLTCTSSSECTGTCTELVSSTVISAGPDANMVRPQCLIEFDVVAQSSGNFAAPTSIFAHHLPVGATFGACSSVSSDSVKCTFSWDVSDDVAGDFRICFSAIDGGMYESQDTFCQSIRIIGRVFAWDLLKLSFPTYDDVQICASTALFWYDALVEYGNTNQYTMSECDSSGANCVPFVTGLNSTTSCTDSGLCSYDWTISERSSIGNVTIRVESELVDATCQAHASELVSLTKRPAQYTILSPGGAGQCSDPDWYKGCTSDADVGENSFSFVVLADSLEIDLEICESDLVTCVTL